MELSVIIVSYNVKYFLEQTLRSVLIAVAGIESELIVVDNRSPDHSAAYLRERFPQVKLIENQENLGFAKACNQGLSLARGRFILFLNPDTLLSEDSISAGIRFLESNPLAGALGIRMVDGRGRFLKESKRAFPSPATSFFKLAGLARLFPRSRIFARYHLGQLDEFENHPVDVLSGAFMLVRREVLDQTGGFDEQFFMYGEDIDLSYRIQEAGYRNFYFSGSSIIHFKGESTRRASANYVRMFYQAMRLFVKKHYGKSRAGFFNFFIELAIWTRGLFSAIATFIRRMGLPLIDAGLLILSCWMVREFWSRQVKTNTVYEPELFWIAITGMSVIYIVTGYYAGLYDRFYKRAGLAKAALVATLVVLAAYSLLSEQYRFSRAIILFGTLTGFLLIGLCRLLFRSLGILPDNKPLAQDSILVVGTAGEYAEVMNVLDQAGRGSQVLGRVSIQPDDEGALTDMDKLSGAIDLEGIREIIFCTGSIGVSKTISLLPSINRNRGIRIHMPGSDSIVGSDSRKRSGDVSSGESIHALADPANRRLKRLIDMLIAVTGLVFFPISLLLVRRPLGFIKNCLAVIINQKTWIGYQLPDALLPGLPPAVLSATGVRISDSSGFTRQARQKLDQWYALHYDALADLRLIIRKYRQLGV